jgi:SAM-dependent methyltransferase
VAALLDVNREFYDALWAGSRLVAPERFNTWPLVESLLASTHARLEVAPGLCPRLPIDGTRFLDVSAPAVAKLVERGADARVGVATDLPWAAASFDLVGAFDILEHLDDDDAALAELARVSAPAATLLLSAPVHPSRWTRFDALVGHGRRYEPKVILAKLAATGWSVEASGVYGMQPSSPHLLDFVVWSFQHRHRRAVWWYSRAILPLGVLLQPKLEMTPGVIDLANVDEALFVCRKSS